MKIAIINESRLVTAEQAAMIATACAHQMRDAAALWDMTGAVVFYWAGAEKELPADVKPVVILDDADQAGALGYHFETPSGKIYARVFVKPTLQSGGKVLDGPGSVCSVTSHEVLEMWLDAFCNLWADGPAIRQGSSYAYEACDAVQGDVYVQAVPTGHGSVNCTVSNFVLPAWFDDNAPHGTRVDYMGTCPGPFKLAKGGYMIVRDKPGEESQVFSSPARGAAVDPAKQFPAARTARRMAPARARAAAAELGATHPDPPDDDDAEEDDDA